MDRLYYKFRRLCRWPAKIGFFRAILFELQWTLRLPRIRVKVPGFSRYFTIRRYTSDIRVFEAVFIDEEVHVTALQNPRLIIDGGANVGFTTAVFALEHPSAQVIAVEPNAANCEMIRINCDGLQNVRLIEGALWSHAGFMRTLDPSAESWGFSYAEAESPEGSDCQAYPIEAIIETSKCDRCDLLKLDVEGAELQLFSVNHDRWLDFVDMLLIEPHSAKAEAVIRQACPADKFDTSTLGEKLYIRRK